MNVWLAGVLTAQTLSQYSDDDDDVHALSN